MSSRAPCDRPSGRARAESGPGSRASGRNTRWSSVSMTTRWKVPNATSPGGGGDSSGRGRKSQGCCRTSGPPQMTCPDSLKPSATQPRTNRTCRPAGSSRQDSETTGPRALRRLLARRSMASPKCILAGFGVIWHRPTTSHTLNRCWPDQPNPTTIGSSVHGSPGP